MHSGSCKERGEQNCRPSVRGGVESFQWDATVVPVKTTMHKICIKPHLSNFEAAGVITMEDVRKTSVFEA